MASTDTTDTTEQLTLVAPNKSGTLIRQAATVEYKDGRIWFLKSPFALKDEIKAMKGAKWHGFDDDAKKMWSVKDCQRNRFQLRYLRGENVYAHFDRPVEEHEYTRPLKEHQKDLANRGLTYRYQIFAAQAGLGKTLAAQEIIERSGEPCWWWVGPKSSIPNIQREFKRWDYTGPEVLFLTYEEMTKRVNDVERDPNLLPGGVIFDEATRLKNPAAERSVAAQKLTDWIRDCKGVYGYAILMSGTPAPKSPLDWWSLCEIAWPGFLKEGDLKAFDRRLSILTTQEMGGQTFDQRVTWRDDERKCDTCGALNETHDNTHTWKPSKNEVAYLFERLKGLVVVKWKKDCLDLPPKRYRKIKVKPSSSMLRAASAIKDTSVNAVTAMTDLRCLSDGFMYTEEVSGSKKCTYCQDGTVVDYDEERRPITVDCPACGGTQEVNAMTRSVREVPCPKDQVVCDVLKECEPKGRAVIFAAFTASVDRVCRICREEGWDVVRLDGRGYHVVKADGSLVKTHGLDYWEGDAPKVAFVANAISGGQSLTLTKANLAMFYSTDFRPEFRQQAEERIHRLSQESECTIVDVIHLPTDERALEILLDNRRLEVMTLGDVFDGIKWEE